MSTAAPSSDDVSAVRRETYRRTARSGPNLVMVGLPGASWHLELVGGPTLTVHPTPTSEDLLVIYTGAPIDPAFITRLELNGGVVLSQGRYWDRWGITIADPDGYRLILSTRTGG